MPKRTGYIFEKICSMENLIAADVEARRYKKHGGKYPYGVRVFDKLNTGNKLLEELRMQLLSGTYENQPYRVERRMTDRKWRDLYKVNYYPTHILHHAVMRVISPYLIARMTRHCYAGIKDKGTSQAFKEVKRLLRDKDGSKFYLQEDVKKFYPTIDQDVAVKMIGRVFKDKKFMLLIDKLLHHTTGGLQIGFYISQLMANYMYTIVDRVVTEKMKVKNYVRFCDDMVVMSDDRFLLARVHEAIKDTVENVFHQTLHEGNVLSRIGDERKDSDGITGRSIDFLGFRSNHDRILLRKGMKKRFATRYKKSKNIKIAASYKGWCMQANGRNLFKKITGMSFDELGIVPSNSNKDGQIFFDVPTRRISEIVNRKIKVLDFTANVKTKEGDGRTVILVHDEYGKYKVITSARKIIDVLRQARVMESERGINVFPVETEIRCNIFNNGAKEYYLL